MKKKGKGCQIIDIAISADNRVKQKEDVKVEKYDELKRELKNIWSLKKAEIIPVIIGALSVVTKTFERTKKRLEMKTNLDQFQKTALKGTARILRKTLEY